MTSYSVLPSGPRPTVIATWPGEWSDHSVKVTTLADTDQASELAHVLTRLSEGAWDAAAWLDTYSAIEAGLTTLIDQLRAPADKISEIHLPEGGYRHTDQWSFTDVKGPASGRTARVRERDDPRPAAHDRRRTVL
ncbi:MULTISPECIES: hypothetical protein [Prauserella]|uniref:Uncharacterized protein n=2 Tax=Prauserella TaxID=142577 RepID=A0A318L977_9PSEU|nr:MULTISPECIES: hypothetical protein [Prauserella]PXY17722.1 hypothetical protein BA062_36810 [Prauserella flavalba]PXY18627.1 hypothetical protein BAY59_33665 [Prauserella coralliicola]TKG63558.1 hypothetical protein FCN18_30110 [Prauserella endophytica]